MTRLNILRNKLNMKNVGTKSISLSDITVYFAIVSKQMIKICFMGPQKMKYKCMLKHVRSAKIRNYGITCDKVKMIKNSSNIMTVNDYTRVFFVFHIKNKSLIEKLQFVLIILAQNQYSIDK